ncbi:MAG: type II toxin-antitoxin system prevent-host-death family antitoxin [Rhodospirillales bacterium]|nr:type II toxin-antitoxin system prevent-host-death family antitoxin [Rhodospirillales bacterium]
MRHVSAANANRHFSKLLRDVKAGEPITITAHGLPVAVLAPVSGQAATEAEQARTRLLGRLKRQKPKGLTWNRDALYDDAS